MFKCNFIAECSSRVLNWRFFIAINHRISIVNHKLKFLKLRRARRGYAQGRENIQARTYRLTAVVFTRHINSRLMFYELASSDFLASIKLN